MSFSGTMNKKNKKKSPLRVRIPLFPMTAFIADSGKKAFLFTPASLTLEASLVLTLFIFAAVCLILPMKIMNTERRIQSGLEAVGEDFSKYAYVKDLLEKGEMGTMPGVGEFARSFCKYLSAGAAAGYAKERAMAYADTGNYREVTMIRSQILEDGETFDLILDYEIQMPFPVLGLSTLKRTAHCRRRAWIGKAGKAYGADGSDSGDQEEIVYVGKNSTRYHRSRSCHYLSNNLTTVSFDAVGDLRNTGGGKYYACSVCGKSAKTGSIVYVMPSGSSFHTTQDCTSIIAYVRAVKLSEAEHLGPCSYCSGGR